MTKLLLAVCLLATNLCAQAQFKPGTSIYTQKIVDNNAAYFTPAPKTPDISIDLQSAIDKLKRERNFGILFIPEGTWYISKTIYIPGSIRLIGYGAHRPLIVLKKNSSGFQEEPAKDKGHASYMFWFTSSIPDSTGIHDAGAGTFYSALSNIDCRIEDGNPAAVALRTHFAQHSFVSHCNIDIGKGKAGLFDVGNLLEDVKFFGGQYGIYTTKASPGWQIMTLDTYFEGQKITAIKTQQAGFTIVRMQVRNSPAAIQVDSNYWEKLFLEDCRFDNISGPAITISNEGNANMQMNIRRLTCRNTPVLIHYPKSDSTTKAPVSIYEVKNLTYGLQQDDLDKEPHIQTTINTTPLKTLPPPASTDVPQLPDVKDWTNVQSEGAKGDGLTDDTKAIQSAIDKYPVLYVPQGSYRITATLKLKPNTVLIGLHPLATNFALAESTPLFSGFGAPVPIIESPEGGTNIITGIGLYTGENNYRAVACKWQANERSMIDDVKFIGGHGTMRPGPLVPWKWENAQATRPYDGSNQTWDTQYWSLWVTNNGGGIFKNIWSASTFATSGFYANNTATRGRIYALSVEHHVRNEVRFNNVKNWNVYALQLEEESRESSECQPLEIQACKDMSFANLYMFRVIRVKVPYPYSIRTWDCKNLELLNVHNYSQIKYTTDNPLYDINTDIEVRPTELARLFITGTTPTNIRAGINTQTNTNTPQTNTKSPQASPLIQTLAKGFEFALGSCADSKGNVYFAEQRMKRIYKWSAATQSLQLLADFPWEPLSLACDSKDHLLVVFRYNPQPGRLIDGKQETFQNPPDAGGTSFSGWGNSGFGTLVYSIDPNNPEATINLLTKKLMPTTPIYKALYPSNRWRDYHDFNQVSVNRIDSCWIAPDEKTIIPICYDLARSCALVEAFPGKPVYAVDEYDKRTVKIQVDQQGRLSNLTYFAEKGEFDAVPDPNGNVWVADGDLYQYSFNGQLQKTIRTPERPSTLALTPAGLFFTGRKALYRIPKNSLTILVNQVAYSSETNKSAIIETIAPLPDTTTYNITDTITGDIVYTGRIQSSQQVQGWSNTYYSRIDFSKLTQPGYYSIKIGATSSPTFRIGEKALAKIAIPAITNFFFHQRAASPQEQEADKAIKLYGSEKTVDLHGGWCDASGDVSKYFSHLAYTNFMSPQQIPMVDWSMINTVESIPRLLEGTNTIQPLTKEALYGADYIMRSLSPEGYFYMAVFTYFDKDPKARRVVGLLANSKTTADYQCAWREGGGMAIAALARISKWQLNGDFSSAQYLAAAEKAFAHLQINSTKYADDHKDNIIDDYCALMAATELWIATGKDTYKTEARKRAEHLHARLSPAGYFIADDKDRPFWHAADAGLPIMALARYLKIESDEAQRTQALQTIKKAIDYNLAVTSEVINPFGYPRQTFKIQGRIQNGFFIPHENESGWWWQGEDARLGSLAAALLVGGRLVYPGDGPLKVRADIGQYASNLTSWVLGVNPYNMCMMYGYGKNNVPYMASMYGHGSGIGGISNGITGSEADGSGIEFKVEDNGNEWRWSEQWIPHSGWFLQAVTALAAE